MHGSLRAHTGPSKSSNRIVELYLSSFRHQEKFHFKFAGCFSFKMWSTQAAKKIVDVFGWVAKQNWIFSLLCISLHAIFSCSGVASAVWWCVRWAFTRPIGVKASAAHHASEGQKTKLVGGDFLEQLLMTTAPTAKRYMSMIMRGLCHKSACPV